MRISVCVPTYERPELTKALIESFLDQHYPDKELCLSDDSRSDCVQNLVEKYADSAIRYQRNPTRLGLTGNLRAALEMSSGDLTVVLGDDDVLASRETLAIYAATAARFPDAVFFYPNLVQIDLAGRTTARHTYFRETHYLPPGRDALAGIWLRSVQIAGMGFRLPGQQVAERFPSHASLFPQVIAAGSLLANGGGCAIAEDLVATRVSSTQLGYEMANGRVPGTARENLGGAELVLILTELSQAHPDAVDPPTFVRIERHIVKAFIGGLPNVRLFCGRRELTRLVRNMTCHSAYAQRSIVLHGIWIALLISPVALIAPAIALLKRLLLLADPLLKRIASPAKTVAGLRRRRARALL